MKPLRALVLILLVVTPFLLASDSYEKRETDSCSKWERVKNDEALLACRTGFYNGVVWEQEEEERKRRGER